MDVMAQPVPNEQGDQAYYGSYGYDQSTMYYGDGSAPSPAVYEALCTSFCTACNRSFMSTHAVLQHLRDHAAHKEGPEAYEAAYLLQWYVDYSENQTGTAAGGWGYSQDAPASDMWYPSDQQQQQYSSGWEEPSMLQAPPSDAYTGSDSGSGMQAEEGMYGLTQPPPPPGTPPTTSTRRGARNTRSGKAGGKGQQTPKVPPPKPEEYDDAFPPLGPNASPVPVRKWIPASTGRSLRADAVEYTPGGKQPMAAISTASAASEADDSNQPAVSAPSSPTKQLRVEAAAWAPTTPVA